MRNYCLNLTRRIRSTLSTRAALADSSRRVSLTAGLLLSVALTDISYGLESKDYKAKNSYLLFAHNQVTDYKEFKCLVKAWDIESKWNPKAVGNKSGKARVYGIPQLKNEKVKNLDPFTQILWGLKYIDHRYKGSPCLLLDHLLKYGYS